MLDDAKTWGRFFEEHPAVSWIAGIGGLSLILAALFLTEQRKNAFLASTRSWLIMKLTTAEPKPEQPEAHAPIVITWGEVAGREYSLPDVCCLCAGFEPSAAAKATDEAQAWMTRLEGKPRFFHWEPPIDRATVMTLEMWMHPIHAASRNQPGKTYPNIYLLYLGSIDAMELTKPIDDE